MVHRKNKIKKRIVVVSINLFQRLELFCFKCILKNYLKCCIIGILKWLKNT